MYFFREIDENALDQALSAAITCTILAGAGPQRSRVLATLYKVLALGASQYFCVFTPILCTLFLLVASRVSTPILFTLLLLDPSTHYPVSQASLIQME